MPLHDPQGFLKDFNLQARPEICVGTPESIELSGKETARAPRRRSDEEPVRLIPETVPPDTPPGWRAFRFTLRKGFFIGTICGVVYDRESYRTVFIMHDTPTEEAWMERGSRFLWPGKTVLTHKNRIS